MSQGVFRHYPPLRLRAPSAVHTAQPPPPFPAQLLELSPQLHLRETERARQPGVRFTSGGVEAPVFPPELYAIPQGPQVHERADARARAPIRMLGALDEFTEVVGGDAHQPPAVHYREPRRPVLPGPRMFTGQAPVVPDYILPVRELRPVAIEPTRARLTAAPVATFTEPPAVPAFPAELLRSVRQLPTREERATQQVRVSYLPAEPDVYLAPLRPAQQVRDERRAQVRSLTVIPVGDFVLPARELRPISPVPVSWPLPRGVIASLLAPEPPPQLLVAFRDTTVYGPATATVRGPDAATVYGPVTVTVRGPDGVTVYGPDGVTVRG